MFNLLLSIFVLTATVYVGIKVMPTVFKWFFYLIGLLGLVYFLSMMALLTVT